MNRQNSRKPSLAEAKANFAASVNEIDPYRTVQERPLLVLGVAGALGLFMGFAGLRLMRKSVLQPSVAYALLKRFVL